MGAALVEMATSFASAHGLERVHERASEIRAEVESLAQADADAYARVLESAADAARRRAVGPAGRRPWPMPSTSLCA